MYVLKFLNLYKLFTAIEYLNLDTTNLYLEPKELGGQHGKPSDCDEETFLLGKSP